MDEATLFGETAVALSDRERFDWLRLFRSENVGPRTFRHLLERYGSAGDALTALPTLISGGKLARPVRIPLIEEIESEIAAAQGAGARFIALCEPDYPALLRRIAAPPPVLAVRGNCACLKRAKVAIVGARNASAAGLALAAQMSRGIAREGYVIVSGLARGIDARAHQAALETGTIAVVAGGLGKIYPPDHASLADRIAEQGAVISEMPFSWEARGRDFPRRNRIVSGLARAVVVVEAARRSGSLITARFAAEQGREIFAVPGSPLDPRAEGANELLRDGAALCTKADDVVAVLAEQSLAAPKDGGGFYEPGTFCGEAEPLWDELDLDEAAPRFPAAVVAAPVACEHERAATAAGAAKLARDEPDAIAARVRELLGPVPVGVDELARQAEAPARHVRAILSALRLSGLIEWHAGDLVSACPRASADENAP